MSLRYPSDISREQFEVIRPILESCRKKRRPRKVDLYDVFCGVLYVLKSGCPWHMLPKDFPKWNKCYSYFEIWSEKKNENEPSCLEVVLKKIGRRKSTRPWAGLPDKLLHNRFPEREEY